MSMDQGGSIGEQGAERNRKDPTAEHVMQMSAVMVPARSVTPCQARPSSAHLRQLSHRKHGVLHPVARLIGVGHLAGSTDRAMQRGEFDTPAAAAVVQPLEVPFRKEQASLRQLGSLLAVAQYKYGCAKLSGLPAAPHPRVQHPIN